jgi:glycosyltransferase involved in cell wall biosynthesis
LRILHLATLVSPDGAYGGPLRVAVNQVAELRRLGHQVDLAAGWRGQGEPPRMLAGVPCFLFPVRSVVPGKRFSGLISFGLAWWLAKNLHNYDVVHIHAGRDLISLASMALARFSGRPYVTQTHGMVQPDLRLTTRLVDAAAARRLLRGARRRFVLTEVETAGLVEVLGPTVQLERLVNGVPEAEVRDVRAQGRSVLFCARLHPRKRALAFVQVAEELRARGVHADFALVGPDEGELGTIRDWIREHRLDELVRYEGALDYEEVLTRMSQADVYLLPSVDEPFPMTLLEALSLGVPSICTDTCGIAEVLRERHAALITDGSVGAMADAVCRILTDSDLSRRLSEAARRVVREVFSMQAVGQQLASAYAEVATIRDDTPATEERSN